MYTTFIFLTCLLLVIGLIFWLRPPKKINTAWGYRSARSMKSQEAWDFANKKIGKYFMISGVIYAIAIVAVLLLFKGISQFEQYEGMIFSMIIFGFLIAIGLDITILEGKLKKKFG
ncbi:MAG: SdpI family protein [Lachnospiraceae bacterium]|jgi:uncharacterized membrane protein|nr:SdpI family protein [Lachnospiraceae bacterium]